MKATIILTVAEISEIIKEHVQKNIAVQKVEEVNFYVQTSTLHKCEIRVELESPKL